jgi:hypothetical protein
MFFKVFEIPKNFFQKVLWWGAGVKPLPYKLQFLPGKPFKPKEVAHMSTKIVYLDNAATSYPKPASVTAAVVDCMRKSGGNPGRGSHRLALAAAQEIYACREAAARMFGADATQVIFTLNTTHALNLAMAGLSILVHAVRLNTLEFSNHKGISWAGYAFKPFKKTKE